MEAKTRIAQELHEIIELLRGSDSMKQALCVSQTDVDEMEKYGAAGDFMKLFSGISNYAGVGYCKWNVLNSEGFATDIWYKNLGEEVDTELPEVFLHIKGVHPEDRARLHGALKDILRGKISLIQDVIRTIDKSTGEFTNWVYCNTLINKVDIENNVLEMLAVNIDITRFKKLELELIESRNEALRLLEQRELVSRNLTIGITYINKDYIVEWGTVMAGPFSELNSYIPGQLCYKSAFNRDTPCEKCPFTVCSLQARVLRTKSSLRVNISRLLPIRALMRTVNLLAV